MAETMPERLQVKIQIVGPAQVDGYCDPVTGTCAPFVQDLEPELPGDLGC